ncbi:hypothetical protein EUCA11A_35090 [Eubacterium callanderi]|uniref:DUF6664 family protein n=2 Tax=Eubacterium callanderi TaxID=53442 RepID=UPI0029FEDB57|nr:hypothetical protein [Eubacterium callanderi]WPK69321.1 hypothetical protein EUCA2A_35090 [Eubacterium callanderi]WPK73619.1 hypothetical protein EUCA11A_35090 [Eubacterium callanderi]
MMCKIQIELPDQFQKGDPKMENILKQLIDGLANCEVVMDFAMMTNPAENPVDTLKASEAELEKLQDPYEEESLHGSLSDNQQNSDFEKLDENWEEIDMDDFYPEPSPLTAIYLDTIQRLSVNNVDYQDLKDEHDAMMDDPSLVKLLSEENSITLTREELQQIHHYLFLEDQMAEMEQEALYFRGHADCLKYLKRMDQAH